MKLFLTSTLVFSAFPALAQFSTFNTGALPVPDGIGGLANVQQFSTPLTSLPALRVQLDLSGPDGFVGDLFVTLQHESGAYTVLLNRPGRDVTNPDGYADRGFQVTFDAAGPDIHRYREFGGPPPGAVLSGLWSADGRVTDPANVTTPDRRSAGLSAFTGIDPNGEWILFLADVNPGGQVFLHSWALDFTPVPEPTSAALATGVGLLLLVGSRRRERTGQTRPSLSQEGSRN